MVPNSRVPPGRFLPSQFSRLRLWLPLRPPHPHLPASPPCLHPSPYTPSLSAPHLPAPPPSLHPTSLHPHLPVCTPHHCTPTSLHPLPACTLTSLDPLPVCTPTSSLYLHFPICIPPPSAPHFPICTPLPCTPSLHPHPPCLHPCALCRPPVPQYRALLSTPSALSGPPTVNGCSKHPVSQCHPVCPLQLTLVGSAGWPRVAVGGCGSCAVLSTWCGGGFCGLTRPGSARVPRGPSGVWGGLHVLTPCPWAAARAPRPGCARGCRGRSSTGTRALSGPPQARAWRWGGRGRTGPLCLLPWLPSPRSPRPGRRQTSARHTHAPPHRPQGHLGQWPCSRVAPRLVRRCVQSSRTGKL